MFALLVITLSLSFYFQFICFDVHVFVPVFIPQAYPPPMSFGKIDCYGFYNAGALDFILGKNRFQRELVGMGMFVVQVFLI